MTYVRRRDKVIPEATRNAQARVRNLGKTSESRTSRGGSKYAHCFFSEFFHDEMNKLCFAYDVSGRQEI